MRPLLRALSPSEAPSYKWFLFALLFCFAFLAVYFPLTNTDIWWHLAAGRLILQTGELIRSDPFSFATQGRPWTDLHWLFQVFAHLVHSLGGVAAIVVAKCLVFASATLLLLGAIELTSNRRMIGLGVAYLAILVYLSRDLVFARPIVLTLAFLAAYLFVLEHWLRHRRSALLILLPVIQLLWCNTQPLFPLGPIVLGCYLVGTIRSAGSGRTLGLTLLSVAAACFMTPYGWAGIELPFELFGRIDPDVGNIFTTNVSENISPWALEKAGVLSFTYFKWIAAIAFGSFFLTGRRIQLSRFLLLTAFFVPAMMANRNILLFSWVGGLVTVGNASAAVDRLRESARLRLLEPVLTGSIAPLVTLVAIGIHLAALQKEEVSVGEITPFRVPSEAVRVLEDAPDTDRIFTSVRYGGYLIWRFYREKSPIIDGRLVLRTPKQFADYLDVLEHPHRIEEYRRAYDLSAALLPSTQPNRYQHLIRYLYAAPDWRLIYSDGTEVLFMWRGNTIPLDLSSASTIDRIASEVASRHAGVPRVRERALVNFGRLLTLLDHHEGSERILSTLQSSEARALLARSYYLSGQRARARALAISIVEYGGDPSSLNLLAMIAIDNANYAEAIDWIRRTLDADPYDVEGKQLLAKVRVLAERKTEE